LIDLALDQLGVFTRGVRRPIGEIANVQPRNCKTPLPLLGDAGRLKKANR